MKQLYTGQQVPKAAELVAFVRDFATLNARAHPAERIAIPADPRQWTQMHLGQVAMHPVGFVAFEAMLALKDKARLGQPSPTAEMVEARLALQDLMPLDLHKGDKATPASDAELKAFAARLEAIARQSEATRALHRRRAFEPEETAPVPQPRKAAPKGAARARMEAGALHLAGVVAAEEGSALPLMGGGDRRAGRIVG